MLATDPRWVYLVLSGRPFTTGSKRSDSHWPSNIYRCGVRLGDIVSRLFKIYGHTRVTRPRYFETPVSSGPRAAPLRLFSLLVALVFPWIGTTSDALCVSEIEKHKSAEDRRPASRKRPSRTGSRYCRSWRRAFPLRNMDFLSNSKQLGPTRDGELAWRITGIIGTQES